MDYAFLYYSLMDVTETYFQWTAIRGAETGIVHPQFFDVNISNSLSAWPELSKNGFVELCNVLASKIVDEVGFLGTDHQNKSGTSDHPS